MLTGVQKLLLGLIGAVLILPLPLILLVRDQPLEAGSRWNWIANRTLSGVTLPKDPAALTRQTWWSGNYQRSVTAWLNENFAGREAFIRGNNQLLWSLFGKSYMSGGNILRGGQGNLFGADYVKYQAGWGTRLEDAYWEDLATQAAALQERLRGHGVAFAVFVTPSKVAFLPEDAPQVYRSRGGVPDEADRFLATLQRHRVAVLDGRQALRAHLGEMQGLAFPRTGLHWSHPAAGVAMQELLKVLQSQGLRPLPSLRVERIRRASVPTGADDDLGRLLNLAAPLAGKYLAADYLAASAPQGSLTLVGGSFLHTCTEVLDQAKALERLRHYHYFKVHVQTFPGGQIEPVDEARIAWQQDFLETNAVVLELNEIALGGRHAPVFLQAALAALPVARGGVEPTVAIGPEGSEWHQPEQDGTRRWVWSRGNARLRITNSATSARPVRLRADLAALTPRTVRIRRSDGHVLVEARLDGRKNEPVSFQWEAPPGTTFLQCESDAPGAAAGPGDPRQIAFGVFGLEIQAATPSPPP